MEIPRLEQGDREVVLSEKDGAEEGDEGRQEEELPESRQ
jgi:hypothetical protein